MCMWKLIKKVQVNLKKTIDMYEITKKQSQGRALKWLFLLLHQQDLVERKIWCAGKGCIPINRAFVAVPEFLPFFNPTIKTLHF